jgi:hypothetical protein
MEQAIGNLWHFVRSIAIGAPILAATGTAVFLLWTWWMRRQALRDDA